jgi:hypothetical protein
MIPLFMNNALKAVKKVTLKLEREDNKLEAKAIVMGYVVIRKNLEKNYYSSDDIHGFIQKLVVCLEDMKDFQLAKILFSEFLSFNDAFNRRNQLLNYTGHYSEAYHIYA